MLDIGPETSSSNRTAVLCSMPALRQAWYAVA